MSQYNDRDNCQHRSQDKNRDKHQYQYEHGDEDQNVGVYSEHYTNSHCKSKVLARRNEKARRFTSQI